MQHSTYTHPAAPARAIPPGEDPLVTRAKVCAQLRTALQILEGSVFDPAHIEAAQTHLQAVARVLFVAKVSQRRTSLPLHLIVGAAPRGGRDSRAPAEGHPGAQ